MVKVQVSREKTLTKSGRLSHKLIQINLGEHPGWVQQEGELVGRVSYLSSTKQKLTVPEPGKSKDGIQKLDKL